MRYPHEKYLEQNRIAVAELSTEIQEQIEEFEQAFGDLAPDNSSEEGKAILKESRAIVAEIKDYFSDEELEEPLKGTELNEWILKQALGGKSKATVTFQSLKSQGFNAKPTLKPQSIGQYSFKKESGVSRKIVVRHVE